MGAWGTGLYSNDSTCDIRGEYVDRLKRGKTNEEITKDLINENRDIIGDVEEEPLFWFALADTQWNYGRLLPEVKEKALYFLSQDAELERWKESGEKKLEAWKKTLNTLKEKLNSPQPKEKKVSKYRLYRCKWNLGDVFAYRFSGDYSKEKGFFGKYVFFRKICEEKWWPGHIVPVIQIYKIVSENLIPINELSEFGLLPLSYPNRNPKIKIELDYMVKLIKESEKAIPHDNLTFLGNLPGDFLPSFLEFNGRAGLGVMAWESSKYNEGVKFEHCVIDLYLAWCE